MGKSWEISLFLKLEFLPANAEVSNEKRASRFPAKRPSFGAISSLQRLGFRAYYLRIVDIVPAVLLCYSPHNIPMSYASFFLLSGILDSPNRIRW